MNHSRCSGHLPLHPSRCKTISSTSMILVARNSRFHFLFRKWKVNQLRRLRPNSKTFSNNRSSPRKTSKFKWVQLLFCQIHRPNRNNKKSEETPWLTQPILLSLRGWKCGSLLKRAALLTISKRMFSIFTQSHLCQIQPKKLPAPLLLLCQVFKAPRANKILTNQIRTRRNPKFPPKNKRSRNKSKERDKYRICSSTTTSYCSIRTKRVSAESIPIYSKWAISMTTRSRILTWTSSLSLKLSRPLSETRRRTLRSLLPFLNSRKKFQIRSLKSTLSPRFLRSIRRSADSSHRSPSPNITT